jgi:hypothetical protein
MASYSIEATSVSQQTPKIGRGTVTIYPSVSVFFAVGENPTATVNGAVIMAGASRTLRLPVSCSKIAFLAVDQQGTVSIVEDTGVKASCSA